MVAKPAPTDTPCVVCLSEEGHMTRTALIRDGREPNQYRCTHRHEFGLHDREPAVSNLAASSPSRWSQG